MSKKALFISIAKRLWLLTAFLLVSLAVISTAVRLSTPLLSRYRVQIQSFASEVMQHPVTIKKVEASWYWFEPVVRFSGVEILNKKKTRPLLRIKQMTLGLDIFASISERHLIPGLILASGANITVHENRKGELKIDGISDFHPKLQDSEASQDPRHVFEWLFSQHRIALEDINIHFLGKNNVVIPIKDLNVSLDNSGMTHLLRGSAQLAQTLPTKLVFNANFLGDTDDMDSWRGKLYIAANDISVPQWFERFSYKDIKPTSGELNIKFWTTWRKSMLQQVQSLVQVKNLNLYNNQLKKHRMIQLLSGNIAWQQEDQGWRISGDNVQLKSLGQEWPKNQFYLHYKPSDDGQSSWQLFVNYFKPRLFANLIDLKKIKNKQAINWLQHLKPDVDIEKFYLNYQDQQWSINTGFSHLKWQAWQNLPGVSGLSGQLRYQPKQLHLNLDSNAVTYQQPQVFAKKILLNQLKGEFDWQQQDKQWQLIGKSIQLNNKDVQLNARMHLQKNDKQRLPTVDISGNYVVPNLVAAKHYLPAKKMDKKLHRWLMGGVQGGQASGSITVQGNLNDFPFANKKGLFLIDSQLRGLKLNYHADYPVVSQVNTHLVFRDRSMKALVYSGVLDNIPVKNINVTIPVLANDREMLNIKGKVSADMKQAMHYIQHSPLIEKLSGLKTMKLSGPMDLTLNLAIALYHGGKDKVNGQMMINDGTLGLPGWRLTVNNIKGLVSFDDKSLSAKSLRAKLFRQATRMAIKTLRPSKKTKATQVDLWGRLTIPTIRQYFSLPKQSFYSGATNYKARLLIPSHDEGKDKFVLNSQLQGITIDAPKPFGKTAKQKSPITVTAEFAKKQSTQLYFKYHRLLSGALQFVSKNGDYALERALLTAGSNKTTLPANKGFSVQGKLSYLKVSEWDAFINEYFNKPATTVKKPTLKLNAIHLTVAKLIAMHHQFTKLQFDLQKNADNWNIKLNGPEVVGNVSVISGAPKTIKAKLSRLHLDKIPSVGASSKVNAQDLPNLDLAIKDFHYEKARLGELDIESQTQGDQVNFKKLVIKTSTLSVNAAGAWEQSAEKVQSRFNGRVNTRNLAATLKELDITPAVDSKDGQLDFNLNWPGSPMDFDIDKVSGTASMNLRRGQITHLDKETREKIGLGKVLSILSLQTLPRRLTLDFSDLSQSGLSFDVFKGDMKLANGVVKTRNTYLDGPVAYASMQGSIDMAKKNYNLLLKVSPHITASLPIVATIAGGPIAGVVTWVASKIISPEMARVTSYTYKISGPWDKPDIKPVKIVKAKKLAPTKPANEAKKQPRKE